MVASSMDISEASAEAKPVLLVVIAAGQFAGVAGPSALRQVGIIL